MKKTDLALILFGMLLLGIDLQGQAGPANNNQPVADSDAFCRNDPRAPVRAYCKDLADLQAKVNSKEATDRTNASGLLNKLDLTNDAAAVKFITATAPSLAARTVLSKVAASGALRDAGQGRPDRQVDANSNASGTTSLVSLPGSAELLGLALDAGILTRSVNGTTATLSTNGDQIFRLITGSDPDCTVTCNSMGWFEDKILNPINISASIDLAQQNSETVATSGQASGTTTTTVNSAAIPTGAGKLSGITARYQFMNKFDPRSTAFKEKWKQAVAASNLKSVANTLGNATDLVKDVLKKSATPLDRDQMLEVAKSDQSGKKLADFFADYFSNASQKPLQDPTISSNVAQVMQSRAVYRQAWLDVLDQAVGNLATFQYNYNRPLNQPITHDFKLIYSYNFPTTGMVTFNGALSIYATVPPGAKYGRTHYGQVSSEYDRTLSGKDSSLQTQLSLAGYWQYQPNPSILNIPAGTVAPGTTIPLPNGTQEFVGTAGSLFVTQAKITIKGSGGINVPLAVSWSNKTDLLQGSKVGGQVGISYNFSSVAGLFTGGGSGQ